MNKSLWYLGVAIALSLNYASVFLITLIWHINVIYSIPLIFTLSFIIGALMANIRDSLICATICLPVGAALATTIIAGPPIVYSGSFAEIQTILAVSLNAIAKILLLNITSLIAGVSIGHFLGER